jgi:hypothetical protein
MPWKRLWLCLPGAVLCAADGCLTLWGQPAAYWAGGYTAVREGNPLAAWLLEIHPLAFAASAVPYLGAFAAAVLALPRRWAAAVAVVVPAAHACGVATWCLYLCPELWWPLIGLWLFGGGLGAVAWRLGWWESAPNPAP